MNISAYLNGRHSRGGWAPVVGGVWMSWTSTTGEADRHWKGVQGSVVYYNAGTQLEDHTAEATAAMIMFNSVRLNYLQQNQIPSSTHT